MDSNQNTADAIIILYLSTETLELKGRNAIEMYGFIKETIQAIEYNPGHIRYTKEVKLPNGFVRSVNVNTLTGYDYNEGTVSPEERINQTMSRLTKVVKENKDK